MRARSDWSQASHNELAAAIHAGNDAAVTEFVDRWTPRLFGYFTLHLMGQPLADAQDLVQETMTDAWKALRTLVPNDTEKWLLGIADNKQRAYWKSRYSQRERPPSRRSSEEQQPALVSFEPLLVDLEDRSTSRVFREAEAKASWGWFTDLLRDTVQSMPSRYRPVLLANITAGKVGQSLAQELGSTPEEAARWLSVALPMLYKTGAVVLMARNLDAQPCRRFQALVRQSGWSGGPFTEDLREKLIDHIGQCRTCRDQVNGLKDRLEFFPVFVAILVPAELYERIKRARRQEDEPQGPGPQLASVVAGATSATQRNEPPKSKTPGKSVAKKRGSWTDWLWLFWVLFWALKLIGPHLHITPPPSGAAAGGGVVSPTMQTVNVYVSDPDISIQSNPPSGACSSTCHLQLPAGTQVVLTAANVGGPFAENWAGCTNAPGSATDSCTVVVHPSTVVCLVPYDPGISTPEDGCSRLSEERGPPQP